MGRRLRALEAAVGQTLFQRTGEGFVLTGEGATVVGHAERVEEEILAIQRQLAGQESKLKGILRLSFSDWFGTHMRAPVLAKFGRRHPLVCVELLTDARLYSLPRPLGDRTPHIVALELDEPPPGQATFVGYYRNLRRLARLRELLSQVVEVLANE